MNDHSQQLRKTYAGTSLIEEQMPASPFEQFDAWFKEAMSENIPDPHAMSLATVGAGNAPSVRTVLMQSYDTKGLVFYTNYNSRKGKEISENAKASVLFFWPGLSRQIRIDGVLWKTSPGVSKSYFGQRPRGSQIAAWVSAQSKELESRESLRKKFNDFEKGLEGKNIPYPEFWGGYILKPSLFEFWQGQADRLHDRIAYTLEASGEWKKRRLAP